MSTTTSAKPRPGTAKYVIANAAMRALGGQPPVLSFRGFTDPVEALAAAKHVDGGGKDYTTMTDDELQQAARRIFATSWSEEEILRRLRTELACPIRPAIAYDGMGYVGMMHGNRRALSI